MSELFKGLLDERGAPRDLSDDARGTATTLVAAGIDPGVVDLVAEHLARWADVLGTESASFSAVEKALEHLALPTQILEAISPAFSLPLEKASLAALALYLVDVSELMALAVYVPELPNISAKADRSGGAARSVGVAKRLRG